MSNFYVPKKYQAKVAAYLSVLTSCDAQLDGPNNEPKEERTKKKKKQKEIKKKEDLKHKHKQREALLSFEEEFIEPTVEEVQAYLDEIGEKRFTGRRFVNVNKTKGWKVGNDKNVMDWKSLVQCWVDKEEHKEQLKRERYAKRQTDSANASGTQTNRGGECVQPRKARHEQLQEILQEEHFVLASVGAELEGVVAASMAGNKTSDGKHGGLPWLDGTDDRLSTLAADFGPHVVIVWLSKVFEAALVRLEVPDERFSARQVVQVAEGLMRVLDVYKGLTGRQVLRAMENVKKIEKGDDIMAALYSEWKG